jgi:hypothetical protein
VKPEVDDMPDTRRGSLRVAVRSVDPTSLLAPDTGIVATTRFVAVAMNDTAPVLSAPAPVA